jgi:hypothetical protein
MGSPWRLASRFDPTRRELRMRDGGTEVNPVRLGEDRFSPIRSAMGAIHDPGSFQWAIRQ